MPICPYQSDINGEEVYCDCDEEQYNNCNADI